MPLLVDIQVDKEWYIPAPYYATTIGKGDLAINLIVAETNSFIDSKSACGGMEWQQPVIAVPVAMPTSRLHMHGKMPQNSLPAKPGCSLAIAVFQ